jgi:hypothetical protein
LRQRRMDVLRVQDCGREPAGDAVGDREYHSRSLDGTAQGEIGPKVPSAPA